MEEVKKLVIYRAYDCMEGYELLKTADNISDCWLACKDRFYDTDGECACIIVTYTNGHNVGTFIPHFEL